jgi:NAD-reducing hydrogenase large subunit
MMPHTRADYLFIGNYLQAAANNTYPYTPPLLELYALDAILEKLTTETLASWWNRSKHAASTFRKALEQQGGVLFPEVSSESLSVFQLPGEDHRLLKATWEKHGYLLAGGQEELAGKVLRISHMGLAANLDVDAFWSWRKDR